MFLQLLASIDDPLSFWPFLLLSMHVCECDNHIVKTFVYLRTIGNRKIFINK
jgi:hypothetical protein